MLKNRINRRLLEDANDIKHNFNSEYSVELNLCNIYNWECVICGPENTPYEKKKYTILIKFKTDFPFTPPKIYFTSQIYHPNICPLSGIVCMEILFNGWSPTFSMNKVFLHLTSLLELPNVNDPISIKALNLYNKFIGNEENDKKDKINQDRINLIIELDLSIYNLFI